MPNTKDEIIAAIREMPDDADAKDIMEQIYFLMEVEEGIRDSEAGRTVSFEEVKAHFGLV